MPIEVQGLESIQRKLKTLDDALSSTKLKRVLRTIGNMVVSSIDESFENEQSPFGQRWAPLKIVSYHLGYSIGRGKDTHTKKGVQTKGFQKYTTNKRILVESGDLKNRWMPYVEDDGVTIANNTARTEKGYVYGEAHQFGTKKIPARPFLPIDDSGNLEPRLLKTIDSYLDSQIAKALGA